MTNLLNTGQTNVVVLDGGLNNDHMPLYKKENLGTVLYEGWSKVGNDMTKPYWQLKRTTVQGTTTTIEYANNGHFDQIWADRTLAFPALPAPPFANTLSTTFDGVNDYVTLPSFQSELTTNYTVSAWVKFTQAVGATSEIICGVASTTSATPYKLYMGRSGGGGRLAAGLRTDASVSVDVVGTTVLLTNVWYNLVAVRQGSLMVVYVNGVGEATILGAALGAITTNIASIGAWIRTTVSSYAPAKVDEVSIWNTDFNTTDIVDLYNAGKPGNLVNHSRYANLVSWYRMGDNDLFPTFTDVKSAKNGTGINMSSPFTTDVP
jgi:hypothetical protein